VTAELTRCKFSNQYSSATGNKNVWRKKRETSCDMAGLGSLSLPSKRTLQQYQNATKLRCLQLRINETNIYCRCINECMLLMLQILQAIAALLPSGWAAKPASTNAISAWSYVYLQVAKNHKFLAKPEHQKRWITTHAPQCIGMQPFSNSSELLTTSFAHKNFMMIIKQFRSYRIDKHTNRRTHRHYWQQHNICYAIAARVVNIVGILECWSNSWLVMISLIGI